MVPPAMGDIPQGGTAMICEDCQKNLATVVITVTAGGEIKTRHLCQDCMKKMQNSFAHGDVQSFLSSLLSMLSASPKVPQLTCSGCGLTYAEFQQSGKLGCAQCYHDFADELRPLLQRIHGRSQHAGRAPHGYQSSPVDLVAEKDGPKEAFKPSKPRMPEVQTASIDDLRAQMEHAVLVEDFEQAAKLRDRIRALSEQKEA